MNEKSALGVARDRDHLALRGPKSGRRAQDEESLPVGDDSMSAAGGAHIVDIDASSERVGGVRKKRLTGARGYLASYRPSFKLAESCEAIRVARLDAELTQRFAALLQDDLQLGAQTVRCQRIGPNAIEPDGTGMADLGS
jgi:hypothetical protein